MFHFCKMFRIVPLAVALLFAGWAYSPEEANAGGIVVYRHSPITSYYSYGYGPYGYSYAVSSTNVVVGPGGMMTSYSPVYPTPVIVRPAVPRVVYPTPYYGFSW